MTSTLVLPRHIDAAFDALDLDQSGLLYVSDAVLSLDSLLIACWGTKGSLSEEAATHHKNRNNASSNNNNAKVPPSAVAVSSGSGSTSDSLTLPGVSRSKILQALKSSLLKANVDPDEVAISSRPVVTIDIFRSTAQSLLSPLPHVSQSDVETFSAFQSLNEHDQEKTRVDKRALRRALLAEYDSDVYIRKDEEDVLDEKLRAIEAARRNAGTAAAPNSTMRSTSTVSRSSTSGGAADNLSSQNLASRSYSPNIDTNRSGSTNDPNHSNNNKTVGTGKFDGIRNFVGCDDLMLEKFSKYPSQGFSFDEWKNLVSRPALGNEGH